MAHEHTYIMVKPDGVRRKLVGEVISRFEAKGLVLERMKMLTASEEIAQRHYGEHEGKPFYAGLVEYITSSPIVAAVFEGTAATAAVRVSVGVTNPAEAAAGTIRADFGLEVGRNLVHASDSPESGEREVALFFTAAELISWPRDTDRWIFEG